MTTRMLIDARHQVSITRLGQRVRVAGGQTLGGSPVKHSKRELQRLYQVLMDWFPGAARLGGPKGSVQEWRGAQACLPDGAPMVGESPVPRVWLNLGHGSSGWAMAKKWKAARSGLAGPCEPWPRPRCSPPQPTPAPGLWQAQRVCLRLRAPAAAHRAEPDAVSRAPPERARSESKAPIVP